MSPNPGVTRRARALHRTRLLEAATRRLGTAQSVATSGVQQLYSEYQRALAAPSAIVKDKDAGRMAQGASILLLQIVITLC